MLIIVEGPECSGKSTLIAMIEAVIKHAEPNSNVTVLHRGRPSEHPLDEYVMPLLNYRPGLDQHIICDRWHVGEMVYPGVYNRATAMSVDVTAYIELFLRSRGAFLVHCTGSVAHLRDCAEARNWPDEQIELIETTVLEFEQMTYMSMLPSMTVDATNPAATHVMGNVREIIALATDEDWNVEQLNPFVTYVGNEAPDLLLFGDRRGPSNWPLAQYGNQPAFMPYGSSSGRYLMETLTSRRPMPRVGLANACDVDDPMALYQALNQPLVVALGRKARQRLDDCNVPHDSTYHPQYWRRFHHDNRRDYLDKILGVPRVDDSAV